MKEITIKLYNYDELSKEAQERALSDWRETVDDPYLAAHLGNLLKEELDERGIKYDTDSINVLYSLGHSQGDGLMFEGTLYPKGKRVTVKHSDAHYYHSRTASFNYETDEAQANLGDFSETMPESEQAAFEQEYREICKKIERIGHDEIEYQNSEEAFVEACEANGYTFEENGKMRNN